MTLETVPIPAAINKGDVNVPLSDIVYRRLLEKIYSGAMAPGTVINEVALAREFGTSRGPVREAIRRLQGIQIVTREPYLKARVVELTAETALELFQMRMGLEGVACYLAAERMSEEEIDKLMRDMEIDHERRKGVGRNAMPEAQRFDLHERLVRASGNKRIIAALCGDLYHLLRIYRRHSGSVRERQDDAYEEHWQILRAIRARDARLAESLMRAHIKRAADHIAEQLKQEAARP